MLRTLASTSSRSLARIQIARTVLVATSPLPSPPQLLLISASRQSYHSRAHQHDIPEHSITAAIDQVLRDISKRQRKRQRKWLKNNNTRTEHPDETIELAVNLNVDPRKPGQALRGSIALPHGTGKKLNCLVFTADEDLAARAVQAGATHAGGTGLVEKVVAGEVAIDGFQRCLATPDIMPTLTKSLARVLGPRGLMPNVKVGTLLQDPSALLQALETQLAGKEVAYRTEKEGIVHVSVGKGSFGPEKLLENIGKVMTTLFEVKPEVYGKGKKSGSKSVGRGTKYLLRASLCSTQSEGLRLDLRTVDPNGPFFLTSGSEIDSGSNSIIISNDSSSNNSSSNDSSSDSSSNDSSSIDSSSIESSSIESSSNDSSSNDSSSNVEDSVVT